LRYEVLIEIEENSIYRNVFWEFTDEPFVYFSLPPGKYRLRVIPYDFRDLPGQGTTWRNFTIVDSKNQSIADSKNQSAEPQLAMEESTLLMEELPQSKTAQTAQDKIIFTQENPEENAIVELRSSDNELLSADSLVDNSSESLDSKLKNKQYNLFAALSLEGIGYTRHSFSVGGGFTLGGSFSGYAAGLSLFYAKDPEKFIFFEMAALFRMYFLSQAKNNVGLFLQAEGGMVLFAYDKFELTGYNTFSLGLNAGWRFVFNKWLFLEPSIRGGYPYIYGVRILAGVMLNL